MSARDRSAAALASVAPPAGFDASLWYRTLFAQSALGVTLADGQRRLMDCNGAFCRIVGRSREELLGRRFYEFNVPGDDDVGGRRDRVADLRRAVFSYEKRYLRADGAKTWVRINLSVLSREHDLYAGIIEDINERKQAEAERASALAQLRDKSSFLARAHTVAKLGTFEVDTRARTVAISAEFARMLAAGDEPFELPLDEYRATFVHPDDREWSSRLVEDAYRRGEPVSWERRLIRRDGEVIWEASHAGFELDEQRPAGSHDGRRAGHHRSRAARRGAARLACADRRGGCARAAAAGARPPRRRPEPARRDPDQARAGARAGRRRRGRDPARRDHRRRARRRSRSCARSGTASTRRSCATAASTRRSARSPVPRPIRVQVVADAVGRHAPTVEEAVFFCVREAIQNATKHAGAGAHVTLALQRRDDGLEFEVGDDGPGFDPREQSGGFGLTSMRDRIAAVGGELEISSAPGQGARVRGTVPNALR